MSIWTSEELSFLREHYPNRGKRFVMEALGKSDGEIRNRASVLGLRIDRNSNFFKEFQHRAAQSKIGKKRPAQAAVMLKNHAEGKFVFTQERREAMSVRAKLWLETNPHPRGMLGKTHSLDVKEAMSVRMVKRIAAMTDEDWERRTKKSMMTKFKNGTFANERPHTTWKAGWREIGGIRKYYRSRWESNYACLLEWLKQRGEIQAWEHEPKVFWFDGIKRGSVSYLPDFRVVNKSGSEEFHEVKGWMDARSSTKIKRMAKYHPEIKLIVIDAKQYKAISRQMSSLVPGWES